MKLLQKLGVFVVVAVVVTLFAFHVNNTVRQQREDAQRQTREKLRELFPQRPTPKLKDLGKVPERPTAAQLAPFLAKPNGAGSVSR